MNLNLSEIELKIAESVPGFKKFPSMLICWWEAEKKGIITNLEAQSWLKDYQISIDNLHNTKGFIKCFLDFLKSHKNIVFKDGLFKKKLFEILKKNDISSLSGTQYRVLAVCYEDIIIPCIQTNPNTRI